MREIPWTPTGNKEFFFQEEKYDGMDRLVVEKKNESDKYFVANYYVDGVEASDFITLSEKESPDSLKALAVEGVDAWWDDW